MTKQEKVVELSDQLLTFLLEYRKTHPDLRFWLRSRESTRSDNKSRLESGMWFQGSEHYIFLSFHDASGHMNMTRSIGWVINVDDNLNLHYSISVVWTTEPDQRMIAVYKDVINELGMEAENPVKYHIQLPQEETMVSLTYFIENTLPKINRIIERHGMESQFLITEEKFQKQLAKVLEYRQRVVSQGTRQVNTPLIKPLKISALNRILYGPPGTGKTYKLQTLIRDLGLEQAAIPTSAPDYEGFAAGYKWWQLMALALLDVKKASVPDLLKHPLLKAKFNLSSIQHPPQRLWSTLQHHTVEDCPHVKGERRFGEPIFYKEADSTWRLYNEADFRQQYPYLVELWETLIKGNLPQKEHRHFTFITCHQSLAYEDFIEGIKPKTKEGDAVGEDEKDSIEYEIRRGVFYQACDEAAKRAGFANLLDALSATKADRETAFQKANDENRIHVLFLDEINRCNVSAVFGELITLIEDDKRLGAANEISYVTLPYSQKRFGVPGNLYIIGTMNTADRSVEALDTALRRRFDFEEMPPKPELLSPHKIILDLWWKHPKPGWDEEPYLSTETSLYNLFGMVQDMTPEQKDDAWEQIRKEPDLHKQLTHLSGIAFGEEGVNLEELLSTINRRIEKLLGKDQKIGHSYFINVTSFAGLQQAFHNKVLPLLQEYFYGDYGKIGLVLGEGFVAPDVETSDDLFAHFSGYDDSSLAEKPVYELKNIAAMNDEQFLDALRLLMRQAKKGA